MEQEITLVSAGPLPGIPGSHAPGVYLVDYETRTIRPKEESAPVKKAKQPAKAAPAPTGEPSE